MMFLDPSFNSSASESNASEHNLHAAKPRQIPIASTEERIALNAGTNVHADIKKQLREVAKYESPTLAKSIWQASTTFLLFFCSLGAMYISLGAPYIVTLLLSLVTGGLLLRIFILQHDCGHGSFFASRRANDLLGYLCSFFTLIPYLYWRKQHAIHHASNGNLDHRGHGDMDVLTVKEYQALSWKAKLRYRIYRNPFVFLLLGPIFFCLVINRFVFDHKKTTKRERLNVHFTNVVVITGFCLLAYTIGTVELLKIAVPVTYIAAAGGIWLFYIQHQFEHTYWKYDEEWDYVVAAIQGSSFYKLPKVLQWLTGSIGYHHIHHLKPGIPNYELQRVHDETPVLQNVVTITLLQSVKTMFLSLWDEQQQRLISFREYGRLYSRVAA